jgi:hypothetical protein
MVTRSMMSQRKYGGKGGGESDPPLTGLRHANTRRFTFWHTVCVYLGQASFDHDNGMGRRTATSVRSVRPEFLGASRKDAA